MNKKQLTQPIIIFAVFLIAGSLMVLIPYQIDLDQSSIMASLQATLPLIGGAMISSGLTFFLIEMVRMDREKAN
jgi:hypothetical protein